MSYDIRFNKFKNKIISIREGEQFCKKCKGTGVVPNRSKYQIPFVLSKYLTCSECFGDGKIDWVELVTGKSKNYMGAKNDGKAESN